APQAPPAGSAPAATDSMTEAPATPTTRPSARASPTDRSPDDTGSATAPDAGAAAQPRGRAPYRISTATGTTTVSGTSAPEDPHELREALAGSQQPMTADQPARSLVPRGSAATEPAVCTICGTPMDPVLPAIGATTHPCCDPSPPAADPAPSRA